VPARQGIETIRQALRKAKVTPEPDALIDTMMRRADWRDNLARAETLARNFRAGEAECAAVKTLFEDALTELREFMIDENMEQDWDDGKYDAGEIKRFIDETR
jgi:hypothetical protein